MILVASQTKRQQLSSIDETASKRLNRRAELASQIAGIVLAEGLGDLGLRGLAARLGTSDRMLIYYFTTKDQLVIDVLNAVSVRLSAILAADSTGPRLSAGRFLARVLALSGDPAIAPFMRLWTEVIARGARGEVPYDQASAEAVRSWTAWIAGRLTPSDDDLEQARPAALLSIVEGVSLLELASPGCTRTVQAYLSRMLDND